MRPDPGFLNQPKDSWAYVRLIGQEVGDAERRTGKIKMPLFKRSKRVPKLYAFAWMVSQVAKID